MSNEVYAPNVHLFAYHFKDNENPDLLYQKCDEILKKLKIENFNLNQRVALNKEPGRKVVDLLNDEEINKNNNPSPPFAGKFLLEDKPIKKEIDKFEQLDKSSLLSDANLKQLQTQLKNLAKTASEYARWLRDLEEQRHTIAINTRNYIEELREIRNKIEHEYSSWLGNDLSFLESFRKNCRHFQEQIQADLGYFVPGSGLLDQAIASIRGIVEIDQAECDRILQEQLRNNELAEARRDRNLETILAVTGVGLAVTEIVGSSTPYLILQDTPKPIQPPFTSDTLHPFTLSLLLSLVCGVAAAGITWVLIRQRHSDNQVK